MWMKIASKSSTRKGFAIWQGSPKNTFLAAACTLMIPAPLLAHAQLGREVVVAGLRDHVEIWDREAWGHELAEIEGSAVDVAERLAAKNE